VTVRITGRADDRGHTLRVDAHEVVRVARRLHSATETEPSVPFLKPMGKAEPDASSRWSWDSVVLAPMAPQVIRSAMNWGLWTC
jgi:hypothetical protein